MSGGFGAGASGLPTSHLSGLKLSYSTATAFLVASGKARSSSDAVDLTSAGATVDMTAAGANGMDAVVAAGTAAKAAGVVTGTGTAFLTAFGTRALTGTITTVGTALTGAGSKFLTEVAVGDLVGTAAKGYSKVTAIASDTAATLVLALPGGDVAAVAGNAIENPTVKVGTIATTVEKITSDTSLSTSETATAVGAGATVTVGTRATSSASTQCQRHYAVWLTNLGLVCSTQRTTLLTAGVTSQRRIGFVLTSGYVVTGLVKGDIVRFAQRGSSRTRELLYVRSYGDGGTINLMIAGAGTNSVATRIAVPQCPPGCLAAWLTAEVAGPAAASTIEFQAAGVGRDFFFVAATAGADISSQFSMPLDAAQCLDWLANNDANNPYYVACAGYTDEL